MAVLTFKKDPGVYHYPSDPKKAQHDGAVTLCGIVASKRSPPIVVEGNVPTNWQPCDDCSERDDRDQRFMGSW